MNQVSPSWNEIFTEIGTQLRQRSGMLTKRVLWITAPAVVFFIIARISLNLESVSSWLTSMDVSAQLEVVYLGVFVVVVVAITTIISTAISKVEQVIWLDSYFDGKNLTSKESWTIAKRLYLPWCILQRKLFFRFYIWIVLVVLFGLFVLRFFISDFARSIPVNVIGALWAVLFIVTGVALVTLTRYFKVKLSYAPFIFLDRYTGKFSKEFWTNFFNELDSLNKVSEGESFKKNVMMELGADAAVSLVQWISSKISLGVGPGGAILALAGKEAAIRIIYYAKLTGRYVLYRFAFKQVHGETHVVNEYIYNLKD